MAARKAGRGPEQDQLRDGLEVVFNEEPGRVSSRIALDLESVDRRCRLARYPDPNERHRVRASDEQRRVPPISPNRLDEDRVVGCRGVELLPRGPALFGEALRHPEIRGRIPIGIVTTHSPGCVFRARSRDAAWISEMDRTRPSEGKTSFKPSRSIWAWASMKPGSTARPARSMQRVQAATQASTSSCEPTTVSLSPAIAIESAMLNRWPSVMTLPPVRTRSARSGRHGAAASRQLTATSAPLATRETHPAEPEKSDPVTGIFNPRSPRTATSKREYADSSGRRLS